jgi:hypothetical protein
MSKSQFEELIRKAGNGELLNARQSAFLANAPNGTIDQGIAELIGLNGGDLRQAAELAVKIADARKALLEQLREIAKGGELPEPDDRAGLLARIRQARGLVPEAINVALDLAPAAGWSFVAEALERRFAVKPKRAA